MDDKNDITIPDHQEFEEGSKEDMNGKEKVKKKSGRKSGLEAVGIPDDMNVTGKERIFCLEYYRTGNATIAAKKAGWSDNPKQNGYNLLNDERIKKYINAVALTHEEHIELERETFVDVLKYNVVASISDFMDDWDSLKDMDDIPKEMLHAVKEVSVNDYKNAKGQVTRTRTNIKLVDKVPYMDMWAKIRNFYKENNSSKKTIEIKFT